MLLRTNEDSSTGLHHRPEEEDRTRVQPRVGRGCPGALQNPLRELANPLGLRRGRGEFRLQQSRRVADDHGSNFLRQVRGVRGGQNLARELRELLRVVAEGVVLARVGRAPVDGDVPLVARPWRCSDLIRYTRFSWLVARSE
jgi:hypothetical protein